LTADSRGGWSEPGTEAPVAGDVSPPSRERYRISDELGAGGMGEVFAAWDSKLAREIALKRARRDIDPQRLAREASITARLEHPGIVPLYDSGTDDEGRVFYTMRLLRGQSLAAALDDAEQSLPVLLRHFLSACQAMAFAHSYRVVHRDLKPANIMLGAFGETHVVDWGLAVDLDQWSPATTARAAPPPAGTAGYIAPERAVSPASDTYSLGKVLEEILVATDSIDDCDRALTSILRKATARTVAKRYPSAAELSRDLEDFLDGRRVATHDYSSWETLQRFARAWRGPLVVAGLSALLLVALAIVGLDRIRSQRNRARVAEAEAVRALEDQSQTLKWALAEQADALYRNGNVPEAEVVAAHSLSLGDSPKARGVMVAARSHARPRSVRTTELVPGCAQYLLSGGSHYVCRNRGSVTLYRLSDDAPLWELETTVRSLATRAGRVAILDREYTLVAIEPDGARRSFGEFVVRNHVGLRMGPLGRRVAASDGRRVVWADLETDGARNQVRPCEDDRVGSLVVGQSRIFVACEGSGWAFGFDATSGRQVGRWTTPFDDRAAPPHRMAISSDESRLTVANIKGIAVEIELATSAVSGPAELAEGPAELQYLDRQVLALPTAGGARLVDIARGVQTVALPRNTVDAVSWAGELASIHGGRAHRWLLPGRDAPAHRFQSPSGLSGMDVSLQTGWVAAARGDGTLSLWSLDGERHHQRAIASHVLKAVSFAPDGQSLAVAQAEVPGLSRRTIPTLAPLPSEPFRQGIRRLQHTNSGELVAAPYSSGLSRLSGDVHREYMGHDDVVDLSLQGSVAWLLSRTGSIYRHTPGQPAPVRVTHSDTASGVAGLPGGELVIAGRTAVRVKTEAGWLDLPSNSRRLLDVATSPDGRFIAAGGIGGDVYVWSMETQVLTAAWKAHDERVSHVRFAGKDLFSASWDGSVRRWHLGALDANATSFVGDAERAWDTTLDEALRSSKR